jgi:membrane protease YdiL (CAAX protease family)
MEQFSVEPWVVALQLGVLFASVVMWLQIAAWWRRGETILNFEPRQPVPWGPAAILPAVAFVLMALLSGLPGEVHPPLELGEDAGNMAQRLVASMLLQVIMVGLVVGLIVLSHATARDLGLVTTARQLTRDLGLGVAAFLAAVAPVHFVQAVLVYLTQQEVPSRHPLVEMVTSDEPQLLVFVLATIAAVVVAPVCEEILYRLVLQGWLEKWEDARVGCWTQSAAYCGVNENDDTAASVAIVSPPAAGVGGLPYGLMPILISSALFGAAHFGYGPEPLPIFLLALVLGYVYQRTHRIIPCIVAHALFNGLTMATLWGMTRNG